MERQKCHCNGSRGTDCDWCGGSGWKSIPVRLNTEPLLTPLKKEEPKIERPQPKIEIPKRDKKTFDERIQELTSSLKISNKNLSTDAKQYLQKRIDDLYSDIIRLENRVTKKQKKHYEKIKSQSAQLIKDFERKFQKVNPPEIKTVEVKSNKIFVEKIEESIIKSQKKKKTNQPTLVNKFKDLFDTLKQRLKQ